MFHNTYQSGLLSIFYSCGSNPLAIWDMQVANGHVKRITDQEVKSLVLEIVSTNVATCYITCPKASNQVLGIRLPFLVMIVKNMKRYFSFEITILDDKTLRRRFRISNFQSTTKIKPFCTTMPIGLSGGWNQIQFNLADFTKRAYGTQFIETLRVQIHANTRLRRIYFSDRLYSEEELPQDYKLFLPLDQKGKKDLKKAVSTIKGAVSKTAQPIPAEAAEEALEEGMKEEAASAEETPTPEPTEEKLFEDEAATEEEQASAEGEPPEEGEAPDGAPAEEGEAPEAAPATEGEATAEALVEASGEAPTEAPAESSEVTPAEVPTEAAAEAPAEAPAEAAAEAPAETSAEAVEEAPTEAPAETIAEDAAEAPEE